MINLHDKTLHLCSESKMFIFQGRVGEVKSQHHGDFF